ncbi:P-loop NTPase fold protein [Flavobacterium anhuiense]|uniref:KAP family P-loop NTPase fold protein n=1 Tax=Flavobacterium anhuiense TaxID=459526 RepID=UPI0011831AC8|nr:P-loop NTPase fold protein [Flavobacterium anhuiense]
MMNKLLPNTPIENLNSETDFLGILDKATLIKDFLKGSKNNSENIKMFSLYGNWGSGKSSLMKFLLKELSQEYNTFFFEAWEFEKDENLSFSLLEYLTYETKDLTEEFADDVLKYGGRILRGLGKSIKLNIPLFPNGPALELDPLAFVEEISKNEELTFYEAIKKFKLEFQRLEDLMTREGRPSHNIVFIDDLDRCEPQQVLNLISAIKLFFTLGKKTIFFCGVDKSAVEAAVETKYGKVVKANEYLEKIFDISFSMPEKYDLQKLINQHFDETSYSIGETEIGMNVWVNNFFESLEFTNPRRIKKVLNKFQMLRTFAKMDLNANKNIPNIDLQNKEEKGFLETILILYLIILHEFYQNEFDSFLNFEQKKEVYFKVNESNPNMLTAIKDAIETNFSSEPFENIAQRNLTNQGLRLQAERSFFICLSPINVERFNPNSLQPRKIIEMTVKEKYIDYLFYKYISSFDVQILLSKSQNKTTFMSLKNLIKTFL